MLNAHFQPPPALHPRDRVAVIAPASAFDRPSFEAGLALIAERYRTQVLPSLSRAYRAIIRRIAALVAGQVEEVVASPGAARLVQHQV